LLLTLKFWLDDVSPKFEKTDIYIEKSVNLSFELMDTAPIDSLIDLGKFIFKEKYKKIMKTLDYIPTSKIKSY
jgi:hypothetical protein